MKKIKDTFNSLFKKKNKVIIDDNYTNNSQVTSNDIEILDVDNKVVEKKRKFKLFKSNHKYGKVEFTFNIISILFICTVGIFYLGRGFYFYSIQHKHHKETASTLNGLLLDNNKIVNGEAEGLHQDDDGYFFKGNVSNNYVWFANRMFRVIRINNDESVKVVSEDSAASFMWGEDFSYDGSNVRFWLAKVKDVDYSGYYYDTIPNPDKFIINTKYTIDKLNDNKVSYGDVIFEDNVALLSLNDYILAGGKTSYLNTGKLFFLLGFNGDTENLYVEEDGSLVGCYNYDGYGVRPVITLTNNLYVSGGNGTKDSPYMIAQGTDTNYVDSYVKLGDDVWKVFNDKDGKLKMYLNGYIKSGEDDLLRHYSYGRAKFDYFDVNNVGYYLLNDYYNNLPYKDLIVDNVYNIGELGPEAGYYYGNVYKDYFTGKISMLSIFDYVSNNELSDFFRNDTNSEFSNTQYVVSSSGLLEDYVVSDAKRIVPVISIEASSLKKGTGKYDDPYIVG